jgi:hypothetical protein
MMLLIRSRSEVVLGGQCSSTQGDVMSKNRNTLIRAALGLACAVGIAASASSSRASIFAVTQGATCFPYGDATTSSGVGNTGFARNGMSMTSTATGGKAFICPVPRTNASSTGTVTVQFQYIHPSSSASFCVADVYDLFGNVLSGTSSGTLTTTSSATFFPFAGLTPAAFGPVGMTCVLFQNDVIEAINSTEQ